VGGLNLVGDHELAVDALVVRLLNFVVGPKLLVQVLQLELVAEHVDLEVFSERLQLRAEVLDVCLPPESGFFERG